MSDVGAAAMPGPQTAPGPQGARRMPRWLLAVLFLSLAVNLLILGSVLGAMWRFRGPPPWAGSVTPNLIGYASTLPMERRKKLWDISSDERAHIRPFRREVRDAREATIKALLAEPFDAEAFRRAQQSQAEAESRARQAVQDLYVTIASGLTPDERRAFPRWRERRRPPRLNLLDDPDAEPPPSR